MGLVEEVENDAPAELALVFLFVHLKYLFRCVSGSLVLYGCSSHLLERLRIDILRQIRWKIAVVGLCMRGAISTGAVGELAGFVSGVGGGAAVERRPSGLLRSSLSSFTRAQRRAACGLAARRRLVEVEVLKLFLQREWTAYPAILSRTRRHGGWMLSNRI